jgi:WD40 repeat protein
MWKIAADPKHPRVAFAAGDDTIGILDLATGKTTELGRHDGRVDAIAFSPSGDRLATGGLDQTAIVWDAR